MVMVVCWPLTCLPLSPPPPPPPPKDKILISTSPHSPGGIQVTNDGATILKAIGVDNPAAKVLVGEFGEKGRVGCSGRCVLYSNLVHNTCACVIGT